MKDMIGREFTIGSPVAHLAYASGGYTIRLGRVVDVQCAGESRTEHEVRIEVFHDKGGPIEPPYITARWIKPQNCLLLEPPSFGSVSWLR